MFGFSLIQKPSSYSFIFLTYANFVYKTVKGFSGSVILSNYFLYLLLWIWQAAENAFCVGKCLKFSQKIHWGGRKHNYVIKQNKSELKNTVSKIQPNEADSFFSFLMFVQSFNCLYIWNQLPNLRWVFIKLKP